MNYLFGYKLQLIIRFVSEGQRKANFEECDAKIRESNDKTVNLKKDIKNLLSKYAKIINNEEAAEKVLPVSRESSACIKRRGLREAISRADEENVRLRKKLDLQQERLAKLLDDYKELMSGRTQKLLEKKLEDPLKKKIVSLENQLHRVSVMQMEADMVRKKYRSVRASLKSDAAFYVSSLKNLEQSIKEQELEIKQLQRVKEEAVELRDITKEALMHQEIEAMQKSKERDQIILDYRQRVEDRKLELERLERLIFPNTRVPAREDDFEGEKRKQDSEEADDKPVDEMTRLQEAFTKLRSATGVTKNEQVLDRFLSQRATKDKLQKMRVSMEEDKISLEKRRQQFTTEIEMQKFSETKDADQNAEKLARLNAEISEQTEREKKAEAESQRVQEVINEVALMLWKFCDRLSDVNPTPVPPEDSHENPHRLLELLEEKLTAAINIMGGPEKYAEWIQETAADKIDILSTESAGHERKIDIDDRPLFPRFPGTPTPAAAPVPSDDEEEVPTRSILKRQAQLLVDTKSRRKAFNFRR
ncbi:Similar to ODAD3: outer dynein arm-docking complex subunit 3 (Mus musculus) [Cotesia congregata]|uniref:Similar to ODAD3: outer dynein arm-docking complex subunit 3 (Mus musculus) n=1 Tax=Cotesia congregata TaxID=51543 RepID=A0A8J2MTQ9_COTCN|nr:Similar to ODAD3: outer dynein arm-docking complex subunit 3 (Mus musculus) [Cotesia congregata]